MDKNNLVERLNNAIGDFGEKMGPALTNLILYGPVDRSLISGVNLNKLSHNSKLFRQIYNKNIFPEVGKMFHIMVQGEHNSYKNNEVFVYSFEYKTPEVLRDRFRISYAGQFKMDDITRNGLFGNGEFYRHSENVRHCFSDETGHILAARHKSLDEIAAKYIPNFAKLSEVDQKNFLNFVVDIAEDDSSSWKNYDKYIHLYSEEHMEMLLGDFFGVNIIDMNQRRAEINMGRLIDLGRSVSFGNLSSIKERFKDHRWRTESLRPGGVHHTFIDSNYPNYPVEVMFRSIKDEALNLYGKHRHDIYSNNGKKTNSIYLKKR